MSYPRNTAFAPGWSNPTIAAGALGGIVHSAAIMGPNVGVRLDHYRGRLRLYFSPSAIAVAGANAERPDELYGYAVLPMLNDAGWHGTSAALYQRVVDGPDGRVSVIGSATAYQDGSLLECWPDLGRATATLAGQEVDLLQVEQPAREGRFEVILPPKPVTTPGFADVLDRLTQRPHERSRLLSPFGPQPRLLELFTTPRRITVIPAGRTHLAQLAPLVHTAAFLGYDFLQIRPDGKPIVWQPQLKLPNTRIGRPVLVVHSAHTEALRELLDP